ncbi:MAG: hypothetical protein Q9192_004887 [Flavoplaca navasiana]
MVKTRNSILFSTENTAGLVWDHSKTERVQTNRDGYVMEEIFDSCAGDTRVLHVSSIEGLSKVDILLHSNYAHQILDNYDQFGNPFLNKRLVFVRKNLIEGGARYQPFGINVYSNRPVDVSSYSKSNRDGGIEEETTGEDTDGEDDNEDADEEEEEEEEEGEKEEEEEEKEEDVQEEDENEDEIDNKKEKDKNRNNDEEDEENVEMVWNSKPKSISFIRIPFDRCGKASNKAKKRVYNLQKKQRRQVARKQHVPDKQADSRCNTSRDITAMDRGEWTQFRKRKVGRREKDRLLRQTAPEASHKGRKKLAKAKRKEHQAAKKKERKQKRKAKKRAKRDVEKASAM